MKSGIALMILVNAAAPSHRAAAQVDGVPPLSAAPASPTITDSRIVTLDYRPGEVVRLDVTPGFQTTVSLAPDEQIESIAVGDPSGWSVAPTRRGDHFFVRPSHDALPTNMTVITNIRTYMFDLGVSSGTSIYVMRFRYSEGQPVTGPEASLGEVVATFRFSGNSSLHPEQMVDDGRRTFIRFRPDQAVPAITAYPDRAPPALVSGSIRGEWYVLDMVASRFELQLDRKSADARRRSLPPEQSDD